MSYKPAYQPASLVKGKSRWYIKLYAPTLERRTFGLNRIRDKSLRTQRGKQIVDLINWWLAVGLPFAQFDEGRALARRAEATQANVAPRGHTLICEALDYAVKLKSINARERSIQAFESDNRILQRFLVKKGWDKLPIDEFKRHHAAAFVDYRQIEDGVGGRTVNNNIHIIRSLFTELEERGFLVENVWRKMRKVKQLPKKIRAFTLEEAKVAIVYLRDHDSHLFLATLMQFCCFIRPNEIRQLRRRDIDLENGVITVRQHVSKVGDKKGTRYATIPTSYIHLFRQLIPDKCNFLFGPKFRPGSKPCGRNEMNRRHREHLEKMLKDGLLMDLKGLVFYSWKRTGMTEHLKLMDILHVRNQAGHSDTKTTLEYYEQPKIDEKMKNVENVLIK